MTDKKRTSSALRELEQLAAVSKEKNGMLRGKAEATRALNAQQATLWQERHGHGHGPSIDSAAGNGGGR